MKEAMITIEESTLEKNKMKKKKGEFQVKLLFFNKHIKCIFLVDFCHLASIENGNKWFKTLVDILFINYNEIFLGISKEIRKDREFHTTIRW